MITFPYFAALPKCGAPGPQGVKCMHPTLHRGCCESWTPGSPHKTDRRWWPA
jgi:hypothetical protein